MVTLRETMGSSRTECHFGGVYRVVGSIIQCSLQADNRICSKRSLEDGLGNTLFNSGEVVLRYAAADDLFVELISFLEISGGSEFDLDVTVLAVSAGLLLVLGIDISSLADGLAVSDLGLDSIDLDLVLVLEHALDNFKLHVADTVDQSLAVLGIVDHLEGEVLGGDLRHCLCDLVDIVLILRIVADISIRSGNIHLRIDDLLSLCGQSVACLCRT